MQNRYAGDFGDYVKLAILRRLAAGRRLGVAWWLHPDEGHNADGKHVAYLQRADEWAALDPALFDILPHIAHEVPQSVQAVEQANILPNAIFFSEAVPVGGPVATAARRAQWGARLDVALAQAEIVFVDPDNGIDYKDRPVAPKCASTAELVSLGKTGRPLIVYHHQRRDLGTHLEEIAFFQKHLLDAGFRSVDALRSGRFSPRVFFILNGDAGLRSAAETFAADHPTILQWIASPEAPVAEASPPARMTFAATILTLYPEMFPGPLGVSMAGRSLGEGRWSLEAVNIRDFATDRHRSVDDTPAGGGAGMVMRADVLARAVDSVSPGVPLLAMTPRGRPLTQARIRQLAAGPGVAILCGRFEGIDERLFEARAIEPVSIGDYILSGGEMAALTLLDACVRLLPGVMGAASSGDDESFETGLLEYPHYTRPVIWEGRTIPEVLRSGNHAAVEAWRRAAAETDTRLRRPDLWERHVGARVQPPSGARREEKER